MRFYESTRTGEFMRTRSPGFDESFNVRTGQWQRTHTLDRWRMGQYDEVEPVTDAEARRRWPEAFPS